MHFHNVRRRSSQRECEQHTAVSQRKTRSRGSARSLVKKVCAHTYNTRTLRAGGWALPPIAAAVTDVAQGQFTKIGEHTPELGGQRECTADIVRRWQRSDPGAVLAPGSHRWLEEAALDDLMLVVRLRIAYSAPHCVRRASVALGFLVAHRCAHADGCV